MPGSDVAARLVASRGHIGLAVAEQIPLVEQPRPVPRLRSPPMAGTSRSKSRPCNGRDFYVVLGRAEPRDPRWEIAARYGLLNAGGGSKYWKQLERLEVAKRVFAYVARAGYVGIGQVTGEMIPARYAEVQIAGQRRPLLDQPDLNATWRNNAASEDPEKTEMVVPVKWLTDTRPVDQAFWEKGQLFSSRHVVCKLYYEHTIETVASALGLAPEAG